MKLCYFDAFSGISGDMTVGALLDAGASAQHVVSALDSLAVGAAFHVEKTRRKGIAASKFSVHAPEDKKHRHLHQILDIIDRSEMSARAKSSAKAIFQKLGDAEARVHGTSIEKVHFHEVGAVDSISDICGAAVALDLLGIEGVVCSPVNVGSGTARTEHGVLPVPTPATALLLENRPVYVRGPELELTTPTGAAIVATLATDFGALPAMTVRSVGYGAGDRDFPEHANVLRVIIGDTSGAAEATTVCVIEANIDDSTPEVLGYALDRLLEKGALDVSISPLLMKKNRPGSLLRVIARVEDRELLAQTVLAETSSLGVRMYAAERRVQARRIVEVPTAHGTVRVKLAADGGFAPEFEDCKKIALQTGLPLKEIIAAANFEYLKNRT
jgi:hypothetical protein